MVYNDGFDIDESCRVKVCPNCGNTEFSKEAAFCRICGQSLFNRCEGHWEEEYHGFGEGNGEMIFHNNPGNARFCEMCGGKTQFFIDGFLKPWGESNNNNKPGLSDSPTYRQSQKAKAQERNQETNNAQSDTPLPYNYLEDNDDLPF